MLEAFLKRAFLRITIKPFNFGNIVYFAIFHYLLEAILIAPVLPFQLAICLKAPPLKGSLQLIDILLFQNKAR